MRFVLWEPKIFTLDSISHIFSDARRECANVLSSVSDEGSAERSCIFFWRGIFSSTRAAPTPNNRVSGHLCVNVCVRLFLETVSNWKMKN